MHDTALLGMYHNRDWSEHARDSRKLTCLAHRAMSRQQEEYSYNLLISSRAPLVPEVSNKFNVSRHGRLHNVMKPFASAGHSLSATRLST